ncbi:hypothetical protein FIBSPDRAFT_866024 [Athelia psychrophila]|uniref:Peptidase C14 caspase domain-containing protein n=1 Tax=Athelia psychrophila TaxID=1759441 RepID=A0A166F218_9AGAM|nr:hypothetical protein FIBSPDRAFT_868934 [Fibularhizoctonia sp. CBS 109695]KZP16349.1 hypothetical protein FIBSPDRAFT_866024 [Fibularhizoctonia sp. CBS 109695]
MSWNQDPYQNPNQQDPHQPHTHHTQHHHQNNQSQNQGQDPYQQGQQQQHSQQQHQHHPTPPQQHQHGSPQRKKALLIGINYTGTSNALQGCHDDVRNMTRFLVSKGYPTDEKSMIVLTDDRQGPLNPTSANMLAAIDWLVSEPNTCCFLHYSGHGGQVKDPDGDRDSGFDDTIVPVDFEKNGQLDSDLLHRHLVSKLHPTSSLFVVFDCCHSGSAIELPFVYRSDADGNVSLVDNVRQGMHLITAARNLFEGGFSMSKTQDAKQLLAGAQSFFHGLKHRGEHQEEGLGEEHFVEDWNTENKTVCMYSGCRDDQTAADASIAGEHVGAMSWAFLQAMQSNPNQSYIQVLQSTRQLLKDRYKQIPQLSVGRKMDLNTPLIF